MKEALSEFGDGRISQERLLQLEKRAVRFRQLVNWVANRKVERRQFESVNGAMFAIAAELITRRTDRFCDAAEDEFDAIEAHGQEPELDGDWLDELIGEKDNFYFSTGSIVHKLPELPRRKRGRQHKGDLDESQMAAAVEEAVHSLEEALAVSHVEKPQEWIEMIKRSLVDEGGEANFWWLQRMTQLSPGALFLGLLLGHTHWIITHIDFDDDEVSFYSNFSVRLTHDGQMNEDSLL